MSGEQTHAFSTPYEKTSPSKGAPAGAAPKGHLHFLSAVKSRCQADAALLKQVFVNLLSNAIKFTRKRDKAEIAIGYQEMDGHGAYCVRHNGVGFYMEYTSNSRQTIRCASPQHTQTVWLILSEVGVFREQRQMLTDGLPDQHAVERVFVLALW